MISINATLIVQVIQFLIFVFILNRLMFRPLLKVIDEHHQGVRGTGFAADVVHVVSQLFAKTHSSGDGSRLALEQAGKDTAQDAKSKLEAAGAVVELV